MTDVEWETCSNPWVMMPSVGQRPSDRKYRLYVSACCRRCLQRHPHRGLHHALRWAERYADGVIGVPGLQPAREAVFSGLKDGDKSVYYMAEAAYALADTEPMLPAHAAIGVDFLIQALEASGRAADAHQERSVQCQLLREVFGNPFRDSDMSPAWRTPEVIDQARAIYYGQTYEHMPLLADLLEEAGCDRPDILEHCRGTSEHVKGCWVIDLLLGRE